MGTLVGCEEGKEVGIAVGEYVGRGVGHRSGSEVDGSKFLDTLPSFKK